jgi:multiple antibiotic resistance protein
VSIFALSLTFFLVANPIGNSPAILSLVKEYDFERQKKIMLRETFFSLLLALFFQFCGEFFLGMLKISDYALSLTGGAVLLLVALQMIFHQPEENAKTQKQEPYIVPIATPLISGPGLMTMIMINAREEKNNLVISLAIFIAWAGVALVLLGAPFLQKIIGRRGLAAVEQVMGMVLGLISAQMIVEGSHLFIKTFSPGP